MKRSDLIGIEVVVNNSEEAKQFIELCREYRIQQGEWSRCNYTSGTMRGLVSKDMNTNESCILVFTEDEPDEDDMNEFRNLKKVDLYTLLSPQFQNGDTVYDKDGSEYVYVSPYPHHDPVSVVINNLSELKVIETIKLSKTPQVTPKDGEWWMCEVDHVNGSMSCVLRFMNSRWFTLFNGDDTLEYHGEQIKPLYRMIRDTDTENK